MIHLIQQEDTQIGLWRDLIVPDDVSFAFEMVQKLTQAGAVGRYRIVVTDGGATYKEEFTIVERSTYEAIGFHPH